MPPLQKFKEEKIAEFEEKYKDIIISSGLKNTWPFIRLNYINALDAYHEEVMKIVEDMPEYLVVGDNGFTDGFRKCRAEFLSRLNEK